MSMDELIYFFFLHFFSNFNAAVKCTSNNCTKYVNFLDITFPSLPQYSTRHPSTLIAMYSYSASPSIQFPKQKHLRLRSFCSDDSYLNHKAHEQLLDFFRTRGYPELILIEAIRKVLSTSDKEMFPSKLHLL